jgi:hypothetical protein
LNQKKDGMQARPTACKDSGRNLAMKNGHETANSHDRLTLANLPIPQFSLNLLPDLDTYIIGSTPWSLRPLAYDNCINTSGFCSAIRNKATAGPLGLRLPCSQS